MKNKIVALVGLSVLVVGLVGCAKPGMSKDFSAEVISRAGGVKQTSKIFVAGDKYRFESVAGGRKTIMIIRGDKNVSWLLMPAQKMYLEQAVDLKQAVSMTGTVQGEISREKVGSAKIAGKQCDKYKVTYKSADGEGKGAFYQWIAKDLVPLKTADINGAWVTEFKSFKKGKPAADLFELPAGYKKFKMPKMPNMPSFNF